MTELTAAQAKMKQAQDEFKAAEQRFATAQGDVLNARAAELMAEYPTITKIGFSANYEYDDEGSYNWYVRPKCEFTEDVLVEYSYEHDEYPLMAGDSYRRDYEATPTKTTVTYTTGLEDLVNDDDTLRGASVEAWAAVCDMGDYPDFESGGWLPNTNNKETK